LAKAVLIGRAADEAVDAVEYDHAVVVLDIRRLGDVEKRLDRVFELLRIPVSRRIPDAVEQRSGNLRLDGKDLSVEWFVSDD
jgi:hypothetical protein